jgi:uncharacterized membrane protein
MEKRVNKGIKWLKYVVAMAACVSVIKLLPYIGAYSFWAHLIKELVGFVISIIVLGIPAFLLGWLDGKNKGLFRK